jgi:peptide/nickel transport system substrate-binding protein
MGEKEQTFEVTSRIGRRTFIKTGGLAVLTLPAFLAACGSESKTTTTGTGATPGGSTEKAKAGGAATVGLANVFLALDPHKATEIGTIAVNDIIYEGLFALDKGDRSRTVPELATASIADKTVTAFDITIREGATFQDGSPLTADDVVYSFERFTDPKVGVGILAAFLAFVDKVTAKDETTVSFKLKHATPLIEERLAMVKIMSKSAMKKLGKKHDTQPVGSGPYQVVKAVANNRVELKKFEAYGGKREALLDDITMRVLLDGDARTSALQSGQVLAIEDVPYQSLEQFAGGGQVKVDTAPAYAHSMMLFNCAKAPFDDVRVRQAVMWAIDRDAITKSVFFGKARTAVSQLPEDHPDFVRPANVYTRDVEKAKSLLKEAGHEKLSIELMISDAGWVRPQGTIIQQQLEEVGITVKLKPGETESLYSYVSDGSYQCYLALGDASIFAYDAQLLLSWLYTGGVAEGLAYWKTAEAKRVAKLLGDALKETDDAKRKEMYGEVQNIIAEQVPLYPLHHRDMPTGSSTKLAGFTPRPTPGVDLIGVGLAS